MASSFTKSFKRYGEVPEDTERLLQPERSADIDHDDVFETVCLQLTMREETFKLQLVPREHDTAQLIVPPEFSNGENGKDGIPNGGGGKWSKVDAAKDKVRECCSDAFTLHTLEKRLPIVKWLPKYSFSSLQSDAIAGLTVGLTVIPQGLAYAQVAILPPQYGLYTAFMGSFVYCFLGTAKDITLGPTAIMSLMTATFGTELSPILANGDRDPTMAVLLAFMVGVIQLVMGILNLGILVNFISYPVLNAFTSAAAITIAVGQVKNFLGLKKISSEFVPMVYDTLSKLPETRIWDMTLGLVSLAVVMLMRHLRTKKWNDEPGTQPSLIVIICRKIVWLTGTGGNAIVVISAAGVAAALESQGYPDAISVTGDIKPGMPPFQPPKFEVQLGDNSTMSAGEVLGKIGSGLLIVPLLSIVETVAIGKAFARINKYKINPTQEMIASGVANMLASFVSSYTITGSFSRTAVNSQTGVKTPLGGVFTGGLIILALCVLTPWFYYIPKAALAAVIIAAVLQMVDYKIVPSIWRASKWEFLAYLITFICSLAIGIEYGILIGIGFSLLLILYPIARPKIKYTAKQGLLVITPMQGLNFPGAEFIEEETLKKAMSGNGHCNVVLNIEHFSDIDYTTLLSIKALNVDCAVNGLNLVVANGTPHVLELLRNGNIKDLKICSSIQDAIDEFSIQVEGLAAESSEENTSVNRLRLSPA